MSLLCLNLSRCPIFVKSGIKDYSVFTLHSAKLLKHIKKNVLCFEVWNQLAHFYRLRQHRVNLLIKMETIFLNYCIKNYKLPYKLATIFRIYMNYWISNFGSPFCTKPVRFPDLFKVNKRQLKFFPSPILTTVLYHK